MMAPDLWVGDRRSAGVEYLLKPTAEWAVKGANMKRLTPISRVPVQYADVKSDGPVSSGIEKLIRPLLDEKQPAKKSSKDG